MRRLKMSEKTYKEGYKYGYEKPYQADATLKKKCLYKGKDREDWLDGVCDGEYDYGEDMGDIE